MRNYLDSHHWITFQATDINSLEPAVWMLLGEARSTCEHMAGTPLRPETAREFYEVALIRGAQATTAIEGNTLTEEQVAGILRGTFTAPPSRAYQEREVRNVLNTLTDIADQILNSDPQTITSDPHTITVDPQIITKELICELNRRVLEGIEHEPHVVPGKVRDYSVGVAAYRGAPAEDCEYLLERLADWLESDTFRSDNPEIRFALAFASAVFAHLYIAWLHPFGDGNGRTARLLEFLILARCGMVPLLATHLLSNHYNLTRDRYYRELAKASRTSDTRGFLAYATQGFVDGLREQVKRVRQQHFDVTWVNFVNETMEEFPASPARDRQRSLVLAMPSGVDVARNRLLRDHPKIALLYAKTGPRTLSRDLNRLRGVSLLIKRPTGWRLNDTIVRAFIPPMASDSDGKPSN